MSTAILTYILSGERAPFPAEGVGWGGDPKKKFQQKLMNGFASFRIYNIWVELIFSLVAIPPPCSRTQNWNPPPPPARISRNTSSPHSSAFSSKSALINATTSSNAGFMFIFESFCPPLPPNNLFFGGNTIENRVCDRRGAGSLEVDLSLWKYEMLMPSIFGQFSVNGVCMC